MYKLFYFEYNTLEDISRIENLINTDNLIEKLKGYHSRGLIKQSQISNRNHALWRAGHMEQLKEFYFLVDLKDNVTVKSISYLRDEQHFNIPPRQLLVLANNSMRLYQRLWLNLRPWKRGKL